MHLVLTALIGRLMCREDASTSAHAADAAAPVLPAVPPAVLARGPGAVMEKVALPPRVSAPALLYFLSILSSYARPLNEWI